MLTELAKVAFAVGVDGVDDDVAASCCQTDVLKSPFMLLSL